LWLEANVATDFRNHIEGTCDVALSGHQHYSHSFYKQNSTGERVLYAEAGALQDRDYPQQSAFRVLLFDLHSQEQQNVEFRWRERESAYRAVERSEWHRLTVNRELRADFRLSENFESFLNNIGSPKFDLAYKHIELLGQVIRNFPGSLPAAEKLEILEACYLLGLRLIKALLRLIESSTPIYREALLEVRKKLQDKPVEEIRKLVDSLVILLARLCVIGTIKKVSGSVGISELEQAYRETLAKVGKTNATQLIHLSIKLDHFDEFPDTYIRDLHRLFTNNPFADTVLSDLVVSHMMTIDLDRKTRESISALFKIKQNVPQLVDRSRKH
jgi:hypothetical protein